MLELQQKFERHLQRSRFFTTHDKVVVAVSTGVDSMVLLDLLQRLPHKLKPQIIVAHLNHELRTQSLTEEKFIRQYCQQHQLKLVVAHWPQAKHPPIGVENAARQVRYRFFAKVMRQQGATILATAHHQNDLAETMLMKLTRGGLLDQLVGIADERPFADGKLVRPLLPFSKASLRQYARVRQLKWYEDQTNTDLAIQRNRFRHQIIPVLEQENPQLLDELASYHQQLQELLAWRQRVVDDHFARVVDQAGHLIIDALLQNDAYLQQQLLRRWLNWQQVFNLKTNQLTELLAALQNPHKPQLSISLPQQWVLEKNYAVCTVKKAVNPDQTLQKRQEHVLKLEQWYQVNDTSMMAVATDKHFYHASDQVMSLWLSPAQWPLRLRQWESGDRLRLKNGHHQRVKRVLIDQKVPADQRAQQLVLVDAQGTVVWLIGRKWSWFDRPQNYQQAWQPYFIGIKNKRSKVNE